MSASDSSSRAGTSGRNRNTGNSDEGGTDTRSSGFKAATGLRARLRHLANDQWLSYSSSLDSSLSCSFFFLAAFRRARSSALRETASVLRRLFEALESPGARTSSSAGHSSNGSRPCTGARGAGRGSWITCWITRPGASSDQRNSARRCGGTSISLLSMSLNTVEEKMQRPTLNSCWPAATIRHMVSTCTQYSRERCN